MCRRGEPGGGGQKQTQCCDPTQIFSVYVHVYVLPLHVCVCVFTHLGSSDSR